MQMGDAAEVFHAPVNEKVAEFVEIERVRCTSQCD
jgi:ABC-type sugar transport system ATPase subunit